MQKNVCASPSYKSWNISIWAKLVEQLTDAAIVMSYSMPRVWCLILSCCCCSLASLLFHSRPLVCLPSTFQPTYGATVLQPTPTTHTGTATLTYSMSVSFINQHSVCRFGELCEEIMFNKWVLFQLRTNSWETCCRQFYCFCLMHKAITACLIYLCMLDACKSTFKRSTHPS